ncbi:ATP-binding protein [Caldimonas tepidiphila]|uniref:ATP-binding protein n=1 Tax=Caldimonas tepidiphila TaxID=2315841 RepID=UPI000E5AF42C|nr:ATP-binding protein [Caldimonas tepidiphila]
MPHSAQELPLDPDTMPCGLLSIADDGRVLAANATLLHMLQLPPGALQGRRFDELLSPGARIYHQMVLRPALQLEGRVEEASLILRAADGSDVHVLFNASRRLQGEGDGGASDCVLLRLEQRKALEDKLLLAQRTAEQMPGVLFRLVSDAHGRYRLPYASKGLAELSGVEPATLVDDASPLFLAVHPDDREDLKAGLERSRATLRTQPATLRLIGAGQRVRWVRVHSQVHQELGEAVVWQGAIYDVTQQRQIDERLREFDKLQAIATLAAGIAHDFNNLLGSIMGLAELCQLEAAEGSRQARNLARILSASHKAGALVRQLLDFSRQTPQQIETLALDELLERSRPLFEAGLPPGVRLSVKAAAGCWVRVDAVRMEQALLNLVNNAVHAMRSRGGLVRIVADLVPAPPEVDPVPGRRKMARLRVIDDGEGIPPELQPKIFEPFFTTKPVGEGTGLGLAAVHGIVTSHGGRVTVVSHPGVGSVFSLLLPWACPQAAESPRHPNEESKR